MARILQRIDPPVAEKLDQQIVKILRARADVDLLGRDVDAALAVQLRCDGLPQGRKARVRRGSQKLLPPVEQNAAHQPRPDGKRKKLRGAALRRFRLRGLRLRLRHARRKLLRRQLLDEIARARARGQIALGQQLRVGCLHGHAAQPEVLRQRPAGRQAAPAGKRAREDVRLERTVKLFIKRRRAAAVKRVGLHNDLALSNNIFLAVSFIPERAMILAYPKRKSKERLAEVCYETKSDL